MRESKSAASVSPSKTFELENNCTFTFNFQPDSRVVVIAYQDDKAITGVFSIEQITELNEILSAYLEKRT